MLWKLHAQHVWFATEPTRIRSPQDNPRVKRAVQDVRGNFGAGEYFTDLADPQNPGGDPGAGRLTGIRVHGTTATRPAGNVRRLEAGYLLPLPEPYDRPVFTRVKVHRDYHVEVAWPLYSVPEHLLGSSLDARVDSQRGSFPRLRAVLTSQGGR